MFIMLGLLGSRDEAEACMVTVCNFEEQNRRTIRRGKNENNIVRNTLKGDYSPYDALCVKSYDHTCLFFCERH